MPSSHLYTLSLHDALPIYLVELHLVGHVHFYLGDLGEISLVAEMECHSHGSALGQSAFAPIRFLRYQLQHALHALGVHSRRGEDRKSTRLNSSHQIISYAVLPPLHSFPTRRSSDLSC